MPESAAELVERIARIIAPEAFRDFKDCFVTIGGETKPYEPSPLTASRLAYQRSEAIVKAVAVLGALKHLPTGAITETLIEYEMQGWRERGIPIDQPELRAIVERKHQTATGEN